MPPTESYISLAEKSVKCRKQHISGRRIDAATGWRSATDVNETLCGG